MRLQLLAASCVTLVALIVGCSEERRTRESNKVRWGADESVLPELTVDRCLKEMPGQKLLFNKSIWHFDKSDKNTVKVLKRVHWSGGGATVVAYIESRKSDDMLAGCVEFNYNEKNGTFQLYEIRNENADIRKEYK